MIKLEAIKNKPGVRNAFIIRGDEPMRINVDLTATGELIVYGYPGTQDDVEQDPVIWYGSEAEGHFDIQYNQAEGKTNEE